MALICKSNIYKKCEYPSKLVPITYSPSYKFISKHNEKMMEPKFQV